MKTWLRVLMLATILCGCQREESTTPAADVAATSPDRKAAVVNLTPAQAGKLGLITEAAQLTQYAVEIPGYGVVLPHEPIATAVAELVTAEATMKQSQSALARVERLAGTAGALSADITEAAVQQAAVAVAQWHLGQQKLTTVLGQDPPWGGSDHTVLEKLATGRLKLLRMTFPPAVGMAELPRQVRAEPIGAARVANSWSSKKIWPAPADAAVPGRSFFALFDAQFAAEGERLQAWASTGPSQAGVFIPLAAVLMVDGKYWCYVEQSAGTYRRFEIVLSRPVAGGYVVDGIAAGSQIVVASAGGVLAQEMNAAAAAG